MTASVCLEGTLISSVPERADTMGWESTDEPVSDSGRSVSRGGLLRTVGCLLALAAYGVTGWLAWRAAELLDDAGTLPSGFLGVLNAPPEAVLGPVFLGGSVLVAHVAVGLTAVALGVGGAAARPLVPQPAFTDRQRGNLRRGGLLLVGVAVVGAGLAAAPFVLPGGVAFLLGLGGLAGVALFVAYLLGALYVVSPVIPPLSSNGASAVVLLAPLGLLVVDVIVWQGIPAAPQVRTAVALGIETAVVVGLARPVAEYVPAIRAARREWATFAVALLAAITGWHVGGMLAPAVPNGFGMLAVLGLVAPVLLARGYVV